MKFTAYTRVMGVGRQVKIGIVYLIKDESTVPAATPATPKTPSTPPETSKETPQQPNPTETNPGS